MVENQELGEPFKKVEVGGEPLIAVEVVENQELREPFKEVEVGGEPLE